MPLYEYRCAACGHGFERIQKFSDPMVADCPQCHAQKTVEQVLCAPAVQFKGSGWYVTDYARKPKPGGKHSSAESKVEASESKPAATSEAKSPSTTSSATTASPKNS